MSEHWRTFQQSGYIGNWILGHAEKKTWPTLVDVAAKSAKKAPDNHWSKKKKQSQPAPPPAEIPRVIQKSPPVPPPKPKSREERVKEIMKEKLN